MQWQEATIILSIISTIAITIIKLVPRRGGKQGTSSIEPRLMEIEKDIEYLRRDLEREQVHAEKELDKITSALQSLRALLDRLLENRQ